MYVVFYTLIFSVDHAGQRTLLQVNDKANLNVSLQANQMYVRFFETR